MEEQERNRLRGLCRLCRLRGVECSARYGFSLKQTNRTTRDYQNLRKISRREAARSRDGTLEYRLIPTNRSSSVPECEYGRGSERGEHEAGKMGRDSGWQNGMGADTTEE